MPKAKRESWRLEWNAKAKIKWGKNMISIKYERLYLCPEISGRKYVFELDSNS